MTRITSTALLAILIAALAPGVADADPITYTTTPFTGTDTSYSSIGSHSLPYTDSYGTTVSSNNAQSRIESGNGLYFAINSNNTVSLTWILTSDVDQVGFHFNTGESDPRESLQSVTLGSDTSTAYNPKPSSTPFIGFSDDTAFNTVTLTFTGGSSAVLTDFIFVTPAAVPEPGSLVNIALAAAAGLGALAYRRRRRVVARA